MFKYYYQAVSYRKLKEIKRFKKGSWLYLEDPTKEELEKVSKKHSLERDLLSDGLDPYEVPRLEVENNQVYLYLRYPHQEQEGRTVTLPILIVIAKEFVLTLSLKRPVFLESFLESQVGFSTTQKTKFFLRLSKQINSLYQSFWTRINREVRKTSVQLEKVSNKEIVQLVRFEEMLNDFLSALIPANAVLSQILAGNILRLYEEDRDLAEDLVLSNNQLIELSKSTLKSIVNVRDAYTTIVSNKLNQTMEFLAYLTVVLNVPGIVSGFYGMNVGLPFANSPFAFWGILIATLSASFLLLAFFFSRR